MPQKLNFAGLDSTSRPAQVKIPVELEMLEKRNEAARRLQAERYPSSQELSGDDRDGSGVEGAKPFFGQYGAPTGLLDPAGMLSTVMSDLNPMNIAGGLWDLVKTGGGVWGKSEEWNKSVNEVGQAWQEGDYLHAVTKGALNMLPIAGPMATGMARQGGVDPASLPGHALSAAIGPKLYGAAGRAARAPVQAASGLKSAVGGAYQAIKNKAIDVANRNVEPHMQYFKAIRPKNQPLGAAESIRGAEAEINRGAEILDKDVVDIFTMDEALDAAKKERIAQARALRGASPKAMTYDMTPIADEMKAGIPRDVRIRQPEVAQAIEQWADETYRGKRMDIDDVDALRKGGNRRDAGFWNKLPGGRMNSAVNQAMNKIETDAVRRLERSGLDDAVGTGTGHAEVNRAIRDILRTEDYIDRRFNVELRQAVQNLPQQIGKLAALGKFGSAAKNLMKLDPVMAGVDVLTGLGEIGVSNFLKELNSTSGQIASAFRRSKARQKPITLNQVSRYQRALAPAQVRMQGQPTVQPTTMTGTGTPGQPLTAQGWRQQGAQALPDEMPQPQTATTTDVMSLRRPVEGEPPVLDAEVLSASEPQGPTDMRGQFRSGAFEMPASEQRPQTLIPQGAGGGSTLATEMPESPLGKQDWTTDLPYYVDRNVKTGKFQRVYKMSTESKERGAVPIGGAEHPFVKKFVDAVGATVVSPKDVKPRRGMFHSFVIKDGNVVDLGDLTHNAAFTRIFGRDMTRYSIRRATAKEVANDPVMLEPNQWLLVDRDGAIINQADPRLALKDATKKLYDPEAFDIGVGAVGKELEVLLKEQGAIRMQYQTGDISLEMHSRPTPADLAALDELFEAKPKAKVSFDMVNGADGMMKNGGTAADFRKAVDKVYGRGKPVWDALRERVGYDQEGGWNEMSAQRAFEYDRGGRLKERGAVKITYFAEQLKKSGAKVEDHTPLPGAKGAFFISPDGKWIRGNKVGHLDQLYKALPEFKGKKAYDYVKKLSDDDINAKLGEEVEDLNAAMRKYGVARVASLSDDSLDIHLEVPPSSAMKKEIATALKERPDIDVSWDLDMDEGEFSGRGSARDFMKDLNSWIKAAGER